MRKLINWCKNEWILIASLIILAFIPLYPKLPLINVIRTWVYIRLDDFVVAVTFAGFAFYLIRKRTWPDTPLTVPILVYWAVGLLSSLFAITFFRHVIPNFFPHLVILNYLRRIEYMWFFFLGFYAVWKKPKNLPFIVWTLAITLVGIIAYGFGQKFLGWPAYLTMNEEFAKGVPLRLPPTARIPSTFGGHYDLAAYLVFVIPIFGSMVIGMKRWWQKIVMLLLAAGGLVMLLYTASRISFGVYLVAISTMLWWKHKKWAIIPVIIISFLFLNSVSTASERFYKTLRFDNVVIDLSTGKPIGTVDEVENGKAVINKQESPATESLPRGTEYLGAPPVAVAPAKTVKTVEVYTNTPLATGSGEIATVSGSFLIQKAFVYDISITTRFQGEWPRAIEAFKRNILLGSGYSSISLATDGDYVRMLGESGVAGTVTFLGIFLVAYMLYFAHRKDLPSYDESFVTGVYAGLVGLFLNAILIDVFEASKDAYTLWLIMGFAVGTLLVRSWHRNYGNVLWNALISNTAFFFYLFTAVLLFFQRTFSMYFVADDFTWLRWAATTTLSGLPKYFTDAAGFFYRPIPKLFYFMLYTVFWLTSGAYHVMVVGLFAAIALLLFALLLRLRVRKVVAFVIAVLFASLSIHHENVIWISGASSLLSVFFLVLALLLVTYWKNLIGWKRWLVWVGILAFSLCSALSWEAGAVTPIIVFVVAWGYGGAGIIEFVSALLTLSSYVILRSHAHAVPPSGDYNVRLSTLPVNAIGNGVGYILAIFGGPKVVEYMGSVRAALRQQRAMLIAVSGVIGLGVLWRAWVYRKNFTKEKRVILAWIVGFLLAISPFVGLGNMAERYALPGSLLLCIMVGLACDQLLKKGWITRFAVVLAVFACVVWNAHELSRVMGDWEYASSVSQQTVLTIKTNYFPLQDKQVFVFVNTPIRYGRAWIFPTGLTDAMWHMFKFNAYPYQVFTADSVPAAFKITSPLGTPDVLVFDKSGKLNKAVKTVQTVEEK